MNIWITRNREPSPSVNQIVIVSHRLHIQPSASLLAKEKILSFTHTVEDIEDIFENIEDIVEDIEDINSPTMSPEHDLVYLQSNVCLNRLASPLLRELTLGPNQAATKYIFGAESFVIIFFAETSVTLNLFNLGQGADLTPSSLIKEKTSFSNSYISRIKWLR